MKLGKATIYFYDGNSNESSIDTLEQVLDRTDWVCTKLFEVEEVEIGEWYDDIKINYNNATQEDFESFFKLDNELISNMVYAFRRLWDTRDYTGFDYDIIKKKVIDNNRILNVAEYQHFISQIG